MAEEREWLGNERMNEQQRIWQNKLLREEMTKTEYSWKGMVSKECYIEGHVHYRERLDGCMWGWKVYKSCICLLLTFPSPTPSPPTISNVPQRAVNIPGVTQQKANTLMTDTLCRPLVAIVIYRVAGRKELWRQGRWKGTQRRMVQ